MKTIGMLGGMSFRSTLDYYRYINEMVQQRLGSHHSAECLLYSFDFEGIERRQHEGRWKELASLMASAAKKLEGAGAELLLICTNTLHRVAEEVQRDVDVPLLHIADATAEEMITQGVRKAGLLGTRFTMEESFYRDRIAQNYGIEVIVPGPAERDTVHRIIYDELCLGRVERESKGELAKIVEGLVSDGAEGIILGCTELPLIFEPSKSPVRLFNTTLIHAKVAVDWALK